MSFTPPNWAIAITASRESTVVLLATLDAVVAALDRRATIDLLINGNQRLAEDIAARLQDRATVWPDHLMVRVWQISLGDKAHAFNTYVHELWPDAEVSFFIDGYARPRPNALISLSETLAHRSTALAAAAVPSCGRGAAALTADLLGHGGLHGNLFAIGRHAMRDMRQMVFRLPVGLYRVDSTLAAALAFRLFPGRHDWDLRQNVAVDTKATWDVDAPAWGLGALRDQAKRHLRQARGDMENWAVRNWLLIERRAPADMPETVEELVADWAARDPIGVKQRLEGRFLRRIAWSRLVRPVERPDLRQPAVMLTSV